MPCGSALFVLMLAQAPPLAARATAPVQARIVEGRVVDLKRVPDRIPRPKADRRDARPVRRLIEFE